MTDRKVEITYTTEADAVLWDGTYEAWDAICRLDWDDCLLTTDRLGTYRVYGSDTDIPIGVYVTLDDRGRPLCFDPSEVTLAPTPPPTPQPGERWLLGMDLGSVEQEVEVVEIGGELYFAWQGSGTMPMLIRVADRHPSIYRRAES